MVMIITKSLSFDMAHRLPNHASKCANLHGHRYTIEVHVDDAIVSTKGAADEGIVIDFADIKTLLMEHVDSVYDHNAVFSSEDSAAPQIIAALEGVQKKVPVVVSFVPTVERLVEHFFNILNPHFKEKGIRLSAVVLWETPTCSARYEAAKYL